MSHISAPSAGPVDWVVESVCNDVHVKPKDRVDEFRMPPVDVGVISVQTAQEARDEAIRRLAEKGHYYDRTNVRVKLKNTGGGRR